MAELGIEDVAELPPIEDRRIEAEWKKAPAAVARG
jgi:hypothetical protein